MIVSAAKVSGLLLSLVAAHAAPPPGYHAVAFVNDPLSHGTLGDGLLSLNEAIRLHNGTLTVASLSLAEQFQLNIIPGTGGTTDVTWIDIDGANTPTITIEQDLDDVLDTPAGLLIRGFGEPVQLDFSTPGLSRGLRAPANSLLLENLVFWSGPYGVHVTQTDAAGQAGLVLTDVRFDGQAQFGVRVDGALAGGVGRVIVERCTFANVPNAIEHHEPPADRTVIFEARELRIAGGQTGYRYDGGGGGTMRFTFDRCVISASAVGIELQSPASGGRAALVEGTHLRVRDAATAVHVDAASDALTWLQCRMWTLFAAPGGVALRCGAAGQQVFGELHELQSEGDLWLAGGGTAQPLSLRNLRCRDGAVTLSSSATQPVSLTESRFDDCVVDNVGTGVVPCSDCCFVGGALGGGSAPGAWQLLRCYAPAAAFGVAVSQPVPAAQLGGMSIAPEDAQIGGVVTFTAELPAGLATAFVLGMAPDQLPVLPAPFWVYVDPSSYAFAPGVYLDQQAFTWQVPNLFQFLGLDLVVQPIVLPMAGVAAPALQFAPGRWFELR